MSIQATSLLAGETSCNSASHLAAIAGTRRRRSAGGFEYASRGEDTALQPSEEAVKRQTIFPGASRQRAGNEKAESWDDSK